MPLGNLFHCFSTFSSFSPLFSVFSGRPSRREALGLGLGWGPSINPLARLIIPTVWLIVVIILPYGRKWVTSRFVAKEMCLELLNLYNSLLSSYSVLIHLTFNFLCTVCERPCPDNYHPVCASDGETYANKCLFEIAKCTAKLNYITLTAKNKGPCEGNYLGWSIFHFQRLLHLVLVI